jgi:hypothetical protein
MQICDAADPSVQYTYTVTFSKLDAKFCSAPATVRGSVVVESNLGQKPWSRKERQQQRQPKQHVCTEAQQQQQQQQGDTLALDGCSPVVSYVDTSLDLRHHHTQLATAVFR